MRETEASAVNFLLPPTPRQLQSAYVRKERRFGRRMVAVAIVLALVLCAAWATRAASIVRDMRIESGANAHAAAVTDGQERVQGLFIFHSYSLWAEFVDDAGVKHRGRADFETMFVGANDDVPAVAHYNKATPDEFVLNWAADSVVWRWVGFLLTLLTGLGICWALFFFGRRSLRRLTLHTRLAERGQEHRCSVISLAPVILQNRPNGEIRCCYALPTSAGDAKPVELSFDFYPSATPVFLAGASQILVLWDAQSAGDALVLRADAAPLALSEEALRVFRERVAQAAE